MTWKAWPASGYYDHRRGHLLELLAESELRCGRHAEVVAEPLVAWTDERPTSEALARALAIALYRTGDQVSALAACRSFTERMLEDHGFDPGPRRSASSSCSSSTATLRWRHHGRRSRRR